MDFKVQDIYSIPYSGNIERIDAGRVHAYSAREEGKLAEIYQIQQERIADAKLPVTVIAPGLAGGLIVRCDPRDAQSVYDVVFGDSAFASKAKVSADIIAFPQQEMGPQGVKLSKAFENAAERFHIARDFFSAASVGVVANLTHAPTLRAEAA